MVEEAFSSPQKGATLPEPRLQAFCRNVGSAAAAKEIASRESFAAPAALMFYNIV